MSKPRQAYEPPRAKVVIAFAAVYTLWGSTYLAIKVGVQTIPPFFMAGTRFLIAGAVLYALTRVRGAARPTLPQWVAATGVGALLLLGGNGMLCWSEQRVPSGLAAVLLATIPIWMVLLDAGWKGWARQGGRVLGGLSMGLAGIGLLVGPAELWGSSRIDLWGASVLMIASVCWSVGSLYSRRAHLPPSPFLAAAMEMLAGGALLVVLGFITGEGREIHPATIAFKSILAVLYLVVFGSLLGFTAYIWLLGATSTARVATYAYVNPLVAVFLGWAIAGEPLTARTLVATVTIVSAVALMISHRPPPVAVAPDTEGLPTAEEAASLGVRQESGPPGESSSPAQ